MVICGMRRLTYGAQLLFTRPYAKCAIATKRDGGLLVALFDSVLRASVIFTEYIVLMNDDISNYIRFRCI